MASPRSSAPPPLSIQQQAPAFDGSSYTVYTFRTYDQDSTQVINAASLPCTPRPESLDAALEQSVEKAVVSIADHMNAEPVIDSQARGEVQGFPAEWGSFTLTLPNGQQATVKSSPSPTAPPSSRSCQQEPPTPRRNKLLTL